MPSFRTLIVVLSSVSLAPIGCAEAHGPSGNAALRVARVTNTISLKARALIRIRAGSETIVTTPEHPFARVGGGWTPAAKLGVGDALVSARSQGWLKIDAIERLATSDTPVYNLTIAPGSAYYVGRERLLVHNMDCGAPPRAPITVNDAPDLSGHCSFCSAAALTDMSVRELARTRGVVADSDGLSATEFRDLLKRLGVIQLDAAGTIWKKTAGGQAQTSISDALGQYIRDEHGQANTFAIGYQRPKRVERPPGSGQFVWTTSGHAITAVRFPDGSAVYIDFQNRPPKLSRALAPDIDTLAVWPTTTDYMFNRHMMAALRDGQQVSVIR